MATDGGILPLRRGDLQNGNLVVYLNGNALWASNTGD